MSFPPYTKTFHQASYAGIDPSRPELSTAGKVVVITGGGGGIGARIVHAFAKSGCTKIGIVGRTISSLSKTKEEVETAHSGVSVHTASADISDEKAVDAAFESIAKAFGKIDIVIGNAGYLPDLTPIADADTEEWFRGMLINVKGAVILCKTFLKHASQTPTLVHVSSGGCHIPAMPSNSAYAVSKMASARAMEYFAAENPQMRVHNLHPGVVQTEMAKKSSGGGIEFKFDDSKILNSFLQLCHVGAMMLICIISRTASFFCCLARKS